MDLIDRPTAEPDAAVITHGWQSWTPTTTYPPGDAPYCLLTRAPRR